MKRLLWIGAGFAVALIALGVVGFVYAQTETTPETFGGFGPGMMGGGLWSDRGPGIMGAGSGLLHEYMEDALAEALGLTPEELEERFAAGETHYEIAQSTGLSDEEIVELMTQVHQTALDAAVADGVITQEQADWMAQRMQQKWQNGFGPGSGGCMQGGGMFGPGGRWNRQP